MNTMTTRANLPNLPAENERDKLRLMLGEARTLTRECRTCGLREWPMEAVEQLLNAIDQLANFIEAQVTA